MSFEKFSAMDKLQVIEFPNIHASVVRNIVQIAAREANVLAHQGFKVVGISIRKEPGRLRAVTHIK